MNKILLEENDKLKRYVNNDEIVEEKVETKEIILGELRESQAETITVKKEIAEESKEPSKITSRGNSEIQMPF